MPKQLFRWFASLKLAVFLIVALALVLAVATVLEAARGREYVQWYVYRSPWFIALLGLLALNILAATLLRFPWGRGRIGFLITHGGLLILLAGAIQTFVKGIEGTLSFQEGETASTLTLTDRNQFTLVRQDSRGGQGQGGSVYSFLPGPVDWPDGKSLDLGYLGGTGLRVLKFYRHAQVEEQWSADAVGGGGPAVKFSLAGPDGQLVGEAWLAPELGGQASFGPAVFELQMATANTMVEDFLRPPPAETDKDGVLSVHYQDRMVRIPVSPNIGKKVPVGESGIAVEIAEYLPNAKPVGNAQFASRGSEPGNPVLELKVHVPGKDKPFRQVAFARMPYLNFDGVHGGQCPVKFWYHHPATKLESGTDFLQTPDGKLHCRVAAKGKYEPRGEVKPGDEIELSGRFKLVLLEYLASAQRKVVFSPVDPASGDAENAEAAALVQIDADGVNEQVWLRRNDPDYGYRRVETADGAILLGFGYEKVPLEFSLKLQDFRRGVNPGGMGDASFASKVRLTDRAAGVNQEVEISMNQPLVYGKYRFYQSSYQEQPGANLSILSVAYDPGRTLKYLGSALICLGTSVMFYARIPGLRRFSRKGGSPRSSAKTQSRSALPHGGSKGRGSAETDLAEVG